MLDVFDELSTKNTEALKESSGMYCITSSFNPRMKYFL